MSKVFMGAEYDWLVPVIDGVSNIATNVIKGGQDAPVVVQQPVKPKFNPIPWIAGGLGVVVIGSVLLTKKRRRRR
jgi:hypothetical protein